jgi:hypothetical protein
MKTQSSHYKTLPQESIYNLVMCRKAEVKGKHEGMAGYLQRGRWNLSSAAIDNALKPIIIFTRRKGIYMHHVSMASGINTSVSCIYLLYTLQS